MMKKLKQLKGETLSETLVSVVIISLALIILPGAVVAAAKVNATAKKQVIYMEKAASAEVGSCDLTISVEGNSNTIDLDDVKVMRFGTGETGLYVIGLN